MEVRGEKINVSSDPSKEIAGLKKMKMMMPESQDSRVWEFLREALKVRRDPLGLCVGTYGPLECSGEFCKAILAVLAEFEAVLYEDHEISFGPSLHRPSTDSLIHTCNLYSVVCCAIYISRDENLPA